MGKKVLIATLYSSDPVVLAITRLSPERVILLIDNTPNKEQEKSLELIKKTFGNVIELKTAKTDVYDIIAVSRKCVEIIDLEPNENDIYVNITSGRKTKAIGLLYASYVRHNRVKKIAYNPEEDKSSIIYLPKIKFKLNASQLKILECLDSNCFKGKNFTEMAKEIDLSPAMFYRAVDELVDMALVTVDSELKITDFGRIVRL